MITLVLPASTDLLQELPFMLAATAKDFLNGTHQPEQSDSWHFMFSSDWQNAKFFPSMVTVMLIGIVCWNNQGTQVICDKPYLSRL